MTKKMLEFGSDTPLGSVVLRVNGSGRVFVVDEERTEELRLQQRISRTNSAGQLFLSLVVRSEAKKTVVVEVRENRKKKGDVGRRARRQHSHRRAD